MYCRFLTHLLAEFDQTTCGRGNTAGKPTIQETVRQHKTEEEKPTSLPTPRPPNQRKGKEKASLISPHFTKLVLFSKITARQRKN
jgi:hypothetical protein